MVDFSTLKSIDGYRSAFPSVLVGMTNVDVERVVSAAHNSVLKGWEPTTEDMQRSADRIINLRDSGLSHDDVLAIVAEHRDRAERSS